MGSTNNRGLIRSATTTTSTAAAATPPPIATTFAIQTSSDDGGGGDEVDLGLGSDANVASMLQRCAGSGSRSLLRGQSLHHAMLCVGPDVEGVEGVFLRNHLVQMYGRCGAGQDAWALFNASLHKNVFSWNIMLGLIASFHHCQHRCECQSATHLFSQMLMEGVAPDKVTFVNMLSNLHIHKLSKGEFLHAMLVGAELELNVIVGTALITMYSNSGNVEKARSVFDHMPTRNVVTWSAMISACAQHDEAEDALHHLSSMELQGFVPRKMTLVSALSACASLASEELSYNLHTRAVLNGYDMDMIVATALIHTYGKCGNLMSSDAVFSKMAEKNALSWTAMMATYGIHGRSEGVLTLFQGMLSEGILPDEVCFLCIMSACSHLGMFDEGFGIFRSMTDEHSIEPKLEHFNSLVDLLGRMGMLEEGEVLMRTMPCGASNGTLLSLLSACKLHSDVERAQRIAHCIFQYDPLNPAPVLLLSRTHASLVMDDYFLCIEE